MEKIEPSQQKLVLSTQNEITETRFLQELVAASNKGNYLFPQSFWAQGVFIAYTIVDSLIKEKVSLDFFLTATPPSEQTISSISRARMSAHEKAGIHTTLAPEDIPALLGIYSLSKIQAEAILQGFSQMAWLAHTKEQREGEEIFQRVAKNPESLAILHQSLSIVYATLRSEKIAELSHKYHQSIIVFMGQYGPGNYTEKTIPREYLIDQLILRDQLQGLLTSAARISLQAVQAFYIKQFISTGDERYDTIDWWINLHNGDFYLRNFFGPLEIESIDPLRTIRDEVLGIKKST